MTDPLDLDRLVELAEAASKTDGEWDEFAFTDFAFEEDRAFVLAVSPSTVLALVRELREVREGLEGLPTWDKRAVPGGMHVNRAAVLALLDALDQTSVEPGTAARRTRRGFRIGKSHVVSKCPKGPSGRHRWSGRSVCVRCGADYRAVAKNWTGWEQRQKRPARQDGLCSGNVRNLGRCLVHGAPWPIDRAACTPEPRS